VGQKTTRLRAGDLREATLAEGKRLQRKPPRARIGEGTLYTDQKGKDFAPAEEENEKKHKGETGTNLRTPTMDKNPYTKNRQIKKGEESGPSVLLSRPKGSRWKGGEGEW